MLDQGRGDAPGQAGWQADDDLADRLVAPCADLLLGGECQLQDVASPRKQLPARLGQRDAAAVAQQQGLAQLHLQCAHLAAQRGLRHAQLVGRAAEAAQLGHLDEIFELFQIHRVNPL